MIVGEIVTTNTKGQVVIPQKIREKLGINQTTPLQVMVSGNSVILHPIVAVVTKSDHQQNYLEILKKTAGSWQKENWQKIIKKRKDLEIKASTKRKKIWS